MPEVAIDRAARMAEAARGPVVALHKYNKLRSTARDVLIFVFEGFADPIFYSVIAGRCGFEHNYLPLVVLGKESVLGLRRLLIGSVEASLGEGVAFFVDNDFDGMKGHALGQDVFCTPTYSIENIVAHSSVVENLLLNEFKLHDPDLLEDLENLKTVYSRVSSEFIQAARDVNLLIYFGRTASLENCGSKITGIDDNKSIFRLDAKTLAVSANYLKEAAFSIVRFSSPFDFCETEYVAAKFDALNPQTHWRGKFWLDLTRKFIEILLEDRNTANPSHFRAGRGKVSLPLVGDSQFRVLATVCDIPSSLKQFFNALPESALRRQQ